METPRIIRCSLSLEGWSPAGEAFPIENVEGILIGSFTVSDGPVWKCFLSARGYPESLFMEDGKCYITPQISENGAITKLIVSILKLNEDSKQFNPQEG